MGQGPRSRNIRGSATRTGWHASLTADERARLNRLLEHENRSGSQQLMHMVDRRLAEIDKAEAKNG